jgi:hypothetical protein
MKAKKAFKRLERVEALLSNVIDQYPAHERGVRELLNSAKASVLRAKVKVKSQAVPRTGKKLQLKAKKSKHGHLTAEGRRRISLAAKKRWAVAKRTSPRKTGSPVRSAAESDSTKSDSTIPPITRPAGGPLSPEASPEPNQQQHEPPAQ